MSSLVGGPSIGGGLGPAWGPWAPLNPALVRQRM